MTQKVEPVSQRETRELTPQKKQKNSRDADPPMLESRRIEVWQARLGSTCKNEKKSHNATCHAQG